MLTILIIIIQITIVALLAPLFIGFIKRVKAHLQNRRGPNVLQLYYDIIKYFGKDSIISPVASWIFYFTPYIYFASVLTATVLLPFSWFFGIIRCDIFLFIYVLAIGRFFLILSSIDTGSTFGSMGGSREAFISALIEPALFLAILTVIHRTSSTDMFAMVNSTANVPISLSKILAMVAFFMVILAETGRIPVDNPDTHLELTMVHEGMLLEYSGKKLALLTWGTAMKQIIFVILFVLLFVPWKWPQESIWAIDILWLIIKVTVVGAIIAIVETSTNKLRLFRVPGFLLVSGLVSLLAMLAQ